MSTYTISADSTPVLDGWGWGDYWSAENWIDWHQKMKSKYGLAEANKRLIEAYHKATMFAASYDWRSTNSTFKNYAKNNGFYEALFSGLSGLLGKAVSVGAGAVNTGLGVADKAVEVIGDVAENAGDTLTGTSKLLRLLIPVIIVIVVVGALYFFARKYKLIKM